MPGQVSEGGSVMPSASRGSQATQSSKDWSESPDQVLDPPPSPLG